MVRECTPSSSDSPPVYPFAVLPRASNGGTWQPQRIARCTLIRDVTRFSVGRCGMRMSPATLLSETVKGVLHHIPGIRDGEPESVHQARVGTRRLRELLPLLPTVGAPSQTGELIRRIGRSLGAVRDLDSLSQLTLDLARRYPSSAPVLAACRVDLDERRQRKVRRLVKRLEAADVEALRDVAPRPDGFVLPPGNGSGWRTQLAHRLKRHADCLERKVNRASGVYFPNRLHKVRISLKKLRYLVEIAEQTRAWQPAHLVRDAKRLQDVLGVMHDMHVLLDYIDRLSADEWRSAAATFGSQLRAEIAERHRDYLTHRDRLLAMAAACRRFAHGEQPHQWRGPASVGAALLVPAGVMWLGRHGDGAVERHQDPVLRSSISGPRDGSADQHEHEQNRPHDTPPVLVTVR